MAETNPGTANLYEWLELEEESGNRTGSHLGATLVDTNTVLYGAGVDGNNAADFEDTNVEALVSDNAAEFNFADVPFTFCGFFKPESDTGNGVVFSKNQADGSNNRQYFLTANVGTDVWSFIINNDGESGAGETTCSLVRTITAGTWYWFRVWHDPTANEIGIYIDEAESNTETHNSGAFANAVAKFTLGARNNGVAGEQDGLIDKVSAWTTVLTDDNGEWLRNSGTGRSYREVAFVPKSIMI